MRAQPLVPLRLLPPVSTSSALLQDSLCSPSLCFCHTAGLRASQSGHSLDGAKAMKRPAEDPSSLSPHRAFVVQFRAETEVAQGRVTGRVEHVVSGQIAHFDSLEELLEFIARVLATVRAPPRRRPRGGG